MALRRVEDDRLGALDVLVVPRLAGDGAMEAVGGGVIAQPVAHAVALDHEIERASALVMRVAGGRGDVALTALVLRVQRRLLRVAAVAAADRDADVRLRG